MEKRNAKLIVNKSGGSASNGSKTFRVTLPNKWVEEMNLYSDNKDLELKFDGKTIIISKKPTIDEFIYNRKNNHLIKLEYFNSSELCTTIIADYTLKEIAFKNYSSNNLYLAFGKKKSCTWNEYQDFLESRCVPKSRDRIRNYLEALSLDSYEPIEIIKKTSGRMAEDNQWIKVTEYEN